MLPTFVFLCYCLVMLRTPGSFVLTVSHYGRGYFADQKESISRGLMNYTNHSTMHTATRSMIISPSPSSYETSRHDVIAILRHLLLCSSCICTCEVCILISYKDTFYIHWSYDNCELFVLSFCASACLPCENIVCYHRMVLMNKLYPWTLSPYQ